MKNSEFIEKAGQCISLLEELKREMKQRDRQEYERWKAGGFAVDGGFVSMYPSLQEIADGMETAEECPECGEPMKDIVNDVDGTNLENGQECSNPDCPSHEEEEVEA